MNTFSSSYRRLLTKIPQPIREKGKKTASATAAIFLIAFLVVFAIRPTAITIAGLLGEIKAREETNQKLQQKIDQIISAQIAYTQIYNKLALIDQALPENPQFAPLIRQIEAERILADLELTELNYSSIVLSDKTEQETEKESSPREINFSASMQGHYPDFKNFLKENFNYRRIIHISNLDIQPPQNQQGEIDSLIISLKGNAFYLDND